MVINKACNKRLAIAGMLGSPFLFIDLLSNVTYQGEKFTYVANRFGGLCNLLFVTSQICLVLVLYSMRAAGKKPFGKLILVAQLFVLALADLWSLYETISPASNTAIYNFLDSFWPVSSIFMLFTGITIAIAGEFRGIKRYIPLLTGLWFPMNIMPQMLWPDMGHSRARAFICGLYTAIAWFICALMLYKHQEQQKNSFSK